MIAKHYLCNGNAADSLFLTKKHIWSEATFLAKPEMNLFDDMFDPKNPFSSRS